MTNPPKNFTLTLMAAVYILAQIIVVPALPELQKIFSTDYKTIQLSIAFFLLGAAIVNIIAGPLSDRFGRRPIALIFYVIFFFSSLGAFLSDNISLFLFFRFLHLLLALFHIFCEGLSRYTRLNNKLFPIFVF